MRWPATLIPVLACLPVIAQNPRYGNKLSPYVASPVRVVDRMLEIANIKPGETLYDLGCGDGRILIAAAEKYKAKAIGVEISPKLVATANSRIEKAGLEGQARVIQGDLRDVAVLHSAKSADPEERLTLLVVTRSGFRAELSPMVRLAAPLVLSEIGWMAMGVVDTMAVGRVSAEAIGAVSLGAMIFYAVGV